MKIFIKIGTAVSEEYGNKHFDTRILYLYKIVYAKYQTTHLKHDNYKYREFFISRYVCKKESTIFVSVLLRCL